MIAALETLEAATKEAQNKGLIGKEGKVMVQMEQVEKSVGKGKPLAGKAPVAKGKPDAKPAAKGGSSKKK